MSAYGIHPNEIDYMICNDCQSEAFAWMAEIFACPTCGGDQYVHPSSSDQQHPADDQDGSGVNTIGRREQMEDSRKRKRRVSDER